MRLTTSCATSWCRSTPGGACTRRSRAAWNYARITKRRVSIEYALIKDINDQAWRADLLADVLKSYGDWGWVHVNLIPLNPTPGSKWTASRPEDEREFVRRLEAKGVPTTVRDTRGREIDGACGQLAATVVDSVSTGVRPWSPPISTAPCWRSDGLPIAAHDRGRATGRGGGHRVRRRHRPTTALDARAARRGRRARRRDLHQRRVHLRRGQPGDPGRAHHPVGDRGRHRGRPACGHPWRRFRGRDDRWLRPGGALRQSAPDARRQSDRPDRGAVDGGARASCSPARPT